MRASMAYFAGVGTVVAAVAVGLGGGLLISNIVSPHEPRIEMSKLEQRMAAAPITATTAPSEPVPRIAATTADETDVSAAPQQTEPQQTVASQPPAPQTPPKPEPQTTASNAAAPAEEKTEVEKAAAPQEAFARARDADIKRAAVEKRRAERRQRWEEKRRFRQPREQELEAVEEKSREGTEPRHAFAVERVRTEPPRIRMFDLDRFFPDGLAAALPAARFHHLAAGSENAGLVLAQAGVHLRRLADMFGAEFFRIGTAGHLLLRARPGLRARRCAAGRQQDQRGKY